MTSGALHAELEVAQVGADGARPAPAPPRQARSRRASQPGQHGRERGRRRRRSKPARASGTRDPAGAAAEVDHASRRLRRARPGRQLAIEGPHVGAPAPVLEVVAEGVGVVLAAIRRRSVSSPSSPTSRSARAVPARPRRPGLPLTSPPSQVAAPSTAPSSRRRRRPLARRRRRRRLRPSPSSPASPFAVVHHRRRLGSGSSPPRWPRAGQLSAEQQGVGGRTRRPPDELRLLTAGQGGLDPALGHRSSWRRRSLSRRVTRSSLDHRQPTGSPTCCTLGRLAAVASGP
jgi:hypothetical protein